MDKVTINRLKKLIGFMKKLPVKGHFSMRDWVTHEGDHDHGFLKAGTVIKKDHLMSCGTTACALGWATAMPYFQKLGLHARVRENMWGEPSVRMFYGRKQIGADDLKGFMQLDEEQSLALFGADNSDKSPAAWASRAEKLLKKWQSS